MNSHHSTPELRILLAEEHETTRAFLAVIWGPPAPGAQRRQPAHRYAHSAVTVAGRAVELSALEHRLLCVLAAEPTRVFTRQELMGTVWGCSSLRGRTLDSHASRLRKKLATTPTSSSSTCGASATASPTGH